MLPANRGCFCCEPSAANSQEMQDQQLPGHGVASLSSLSTEASHSFLMHTQAGSANRADLTLGAHEANGGGQQNSCTDGWNGASGNDISDEFEMGQGSGSHRVFSSVNNLSISDNIRSEGCSWNFHALQERELGGKSLRMPVGGTERLPSASGILSSGEYGVTVAGGVCDKLAAGAANKIRADVMDIDGALDELGMLSSITNSRKEYLLETRSQDSYMKQERRLHSKSKSSPNLTALSHPNGYRIIQMNPDFVTGLSSTVPLPSQSSTALSSKPLPRSDFFRQMEYRAPNVLQEASRRRSGPQMSRIHKDRYLYRRSRCPYKIPNRLCTSLQEPDFGASYFDTCASSFDTSVSSSSSLSLEPSVNTLSIELATCQQPSESKSNSSSPLRPFADMRLTRSLSAEDLATTCRRLKQEFTDKCRETSSAEKNLDMMTSQMTNLHMS
ncbi:unnamed protein product [Candidula unifasciata]|uniref:Uncharacterized protein n=1 Tax=Candidula unifasciata TaxID=100452 RepID=A0A8S3Z3X9_9EUPU|nr:unnamed protein product [Candidula unifasciata]